MNGLLIALRAQHYKPVVRRAICIVKVVPHVQITGKIWPCIQIIDFIKNCFGLIVAVGYLGREDGTLRERADGECGDNAKVIAATTQREIEVGMFALRCVGNCAVCKDDLNMAY